MILQEISINNMENYLGQTINELPKKIILKEHGNITPNNKKTYINDFNLNTFFFLGKSCNSLFVETNSEGKITKFFFRTNTNIIDKNDYLKLKTKYGEPNLMVKMGGTIRQEQTIKHNYIASSINSEAINCSFEEKPIIIKWSKENFDLSINMFYEKSQSFITFKAK